MKKHIKSKIFKKSQKRVLVLFVFLLLFGAVFLPGILEAQTAYVPLAPLPGTGEGESVTAETYLSSLYVVLIGAAGILAVIMIVVGGLEYMTTVTESGKEQGKNRVTQAVLGLVLAIASYLILFTINPATLNLSLNPPPPSAPEGYVPPLQDDLEETQDEHPDTYWVGRRESQFIPGGSWWWSDDDQCVPPTVFQGLTAGPFETNAECQSHISSQGLPTVTSPPECELFTCYNNTTGVGN